MCPLLYSYFHRFWPGAQVRAQVAVTPRKVECFLNCACSDKLFIPHTYLNALMIYLNDMERDVRVETMYLLPEGKRSQWQISFFGTWHLLFPHRSCRLRLNSETLWLTLRYKIVKVKLQSVPEHCWVNHNLKVMNERSYFCNSIFVFANQENF